MPAKQAAAITWVITQRGMGDVLVDAPDDVLTMIIESGRGIIVGAAIADSAAGSLREAFETLVDKYITAPPGRLVSAAALRADVLAERLRFSPAPDVVTATPGEMQQAGQAIDAFMATMADPDGFSALHVKLPDTTLRILYMRAARFLAKKHWSGRSEMPPPVITVEVDGDVSVWSASLLGDDGESRGLILVPLTEAGAVAREDDGEVRGFPPGTVAFSVDVEPLDKAERAELTRLGWPRKEKGTPSIVTITGRDFGPAAREDAWQITAALAAVTELIESGKPDIEGTTTVDDECLATYTAVESDGTG